MYIFTPEQHCLLSLSANIWRLRNEAKRHGLRFNEKSATEVFLLDLASQFPGNAKIVPFNRREEGRIGADWAWAFVGPDGQWCQGMLVQAKRLDDGDREYAELFYRPPAKGSHPSIAQIDRLIDNGRRLGLPPVFALYNHLSAPERVPSGRCGLGSGARRTVTGLGEFATRRLVRHRHRPRLACTWDERGIAERTKMLGRAICRTWPWPG